MKNNRIMWGVFFIAAAILLVVNQLGYFTGINLWSLFFTVLLVPVIVSGLSRRNFFNIFFGIGLLLIIFSEPLNITALVPWTVLFAALFLSIGCTILFKPRRLRGHTQFHDRQWRERDSDFTKYETAEQLEGNDVNCHVSLGGSCKYLRSDSLRTGRFVCSLGYLKLYFDNVTLHQGGAAVTVDCTMGKMELFIPRQWNVVIDIESILGDIREAYHTYTPGAPTLTISGSVKMGEIVISYI